jgi:DNA-binding transcriptional LysR family regulator
MMEKFIEKYDVPFTRRIELTSNEAVKQSILAGLGFSIMPLIGLRHELQQGELAIIPYDGLPLLSQLVPDLAEREETVAGCAGFRRIM